MKNCIGQLPNENLKTMTWWGGQLYQKWHRKAIKDWEPLKNILNFSTYWYASKQLKDLITWKRVATQITRGDYVYIYIIKFCKAKIKITILKEANGIRDFVEKEDRKGKLFELIKDIYKFNSEKSVN